MDSKRPTLDARRPMGDRRPTMDGLRLDFSAPPTTLIFLWLELVSDSPTLADNWLLCHFFVQYWTFCGQKLPFYVNCLLEAGCLFSGAGFGRLKTRKYSDEKLALSHFLWRRFCLGFCLIAVVNKPGGEPLETSQAQRRNLAKKCALCNL